MRLSRRDDRSRPRWGLRALAVFGLLALLVPIAVTAGAQGVSIEVTNVKPVQVLEDVPMVVGKTTVLRVDVNAGGPVNATVDVTFGASSKSVNVPLNGGGNTFYVQVDPPAAAGMIEVGAQIGGSRKTTQAQVVWLQRGWMKVLFLPVDWTKQDRARYWPKYYNDFVAAGTDFFKATYPFPEVNLTITPATAMHMLSVKERAIVDGRGNLKWPAITAMYNSIAAAGRRQMGDADLVVGVLPPRWFARNLNEPNTVGLELHAVRSVVSSQVDADYATLAHETGHTMGLRDDYNFNHNPPKIGNPIDAPGYWLAKSRPFNPGGGVVCYSFMGAQDAGSQYWVDRDTYITILQMLQSGIGFSR